MSLCESGEALRCGRGSEQATLARARASRRIRWKEPPASARFSLSCSFLHTPEWQRVYVYMYLSIYVSIYVYICTFLEEYICF